MTTIAPDIAYWLRRLARMEARENLLRKLLEELTA
jgi:hypothetical protein